LTWGPGCRKSEPAEPGLESCRPGAGAGRLGKAREEAEADCGREGGGRGARAKILLCFGKDLEKKSGGKGNFMGFACSTSFLGGLGLAARTAPPSCSSLLCTCTFSLSCCNKSAVSWSSRAATNNRATESTSLSGFGQWCERIFDHTSMYRGKPDRGAKSAGSLNDTSKEPRRGYRTFWVGAFGSTNQPPLL